MKNASNSYTFFKPDYGYYLYILYKNNFNLYTKSKNANKYISKLQELKYDIIRTNTMLNSFGYTLMTKM